mmetsp:Transcript_7190/g.10972  ORF Transcript_7190/g.10972 Transcript_7190/m.10972 type:complete len:201 (+) Transcript_7190:228-830(+)
MILRRRHEHRRLSITKRQTRCLWTSHERFNNTRIASGTKGPVRHDFLHCLNRLCLGGGEEHTLTRCQSRCLDYLTIILVQTLNVGNGLIGICEIAIFGSGDAMFLQKIFGECLTRLQLRPGLTRTKYSYVRTCYRQCIHYTIDQRLFWSNNDHFRIDTFRQFNNRVIVLFPIHAFRVGNFPTLNGCTTVSRTTNDTLYQW